MSQSKFLLAIQIIVTALTCAFLIVPAIMSMAAGHVDLTQTPAAAPHGPLSVFFRPEAVRLADPDGGALRCRVAGVHFHGGSKRCFLETDAGPELIVDTTNAQAIKVGDTVGIDIDPRGLLVF